MNVFESNSVTVNISRKFGELIGNDIDFNRKNKKSKEKNYLNIIRHLFKHHLPKDEVRDHKIHILRIYFTIKILKNNFLAHFLLFNFM